MMKVFLAIFLFAAHICLFFDMSSLQKSPVCKLNYLLGSLIATIPAMVFSYLVVIPSPIELFGILAGITLVSSILVISTIQKYLDYDVDF